jgi:hypothetical protein
MALDRPPLVRGAVFLLVAEFQPACVIAGKRNQPDDDQQEK